ncbi:hypothetical protein C1H46_030960 [Malus baccata]|uniref:Uncharacterized protein n=1 Tax=Malus baccata TaxID=106549 RepID=A0A540LAL2_MALBA|nr:hypothetical protein C1H46_030960 [Malus baccata]
MNRLVIVLVNVHVLLQNLQNRIGVDGSHSGKCFSALVDVLASLNHVTEPHRAAHDGIEIWMSGRRCDHRAINPMPWLEISVLQSHKESFLRSSPNYANSDACAA